MGDAEPHTFLGEEPLYRARPKFHLASKIRRLESGRTVRAVCMIAAFFQPIALAEARENPEIGRPCVEDSVELLRGVTHHDLPDVVVIPLVL